MALVFATMHLYNIFSIMFLSVPFSYIYIYIYPGIDKSDENPRYQHVLALYAFLKIYFYNEGDI